MSSRYFLTGLGISVSTDRRSTGGDQSVGSEGLILHFISASVFKFIQMCYFNISVRGTVLCNEIMGIV